MDIAKALGDLLIARNLTIAVAESCTGGLISHLITNISGSSGYLLGGIVAYGYDAKVNLLGVQRDDLVRDGAVSDIVAQQMADGVLRAFGADLTVSVTGIAGPGGGLPNKPVGLTYFGLAQTGQPTQTARHIWVADREGNKALSAEFALQWMLQTVRQR
jgi:PncC family amidohydrolase